MHSLSFYQDRGVGQGRLAWGDGAAAPGAFKFQPTATVGRAQGVIQTHSINVESRNYTMAEKGKKGHQRRYNPG